MLINFNNLEINNLHPKTEFEKKVIFFIEDWLSDSKMVKVQTSGSTGIPKIFEIEKNKMLNSAKMTCSFLELKKNDTALLCLPVEYISGKMMLVRSMNQEMKIIIQEPSINPLENLDKSIDFCAMTPLQIENSVDKLHLINKLIIGGATVSNTLKSKLSAINTDIYETYGMSETLSHIALKKIRPQSEDYFTCFDGVDIATDERGCLRIHAPNLNDEVLQTNDLVEMISPKQFRFLGRVDNIINSGGAKISPEQLEKIVKENIPNETVFIGLEDEKLGQKLVLVIEGTETESILNQLSKINYQQKFHRPKEILFIDKIPRTENGKVSRIKLKELLNAKNHD